MDPSPQDLTDQINEATTLLLQSAGRLTDDQVREPSLLDGWTRGYVLAHLTRSADALRKLLEDDPSNESDGYEDDKAGAAALTADVRDSAAALQAAFEARTAAGAWSAPIYLDGKAVPAAHLLIIRLVEVELHHVDLDAGYRPSDWPVTFNELQLLDPQRQWRADRLV